MKPIWLVSILMIVGMVQAFAVQSFTVASRGRTYTVTTQAVGQVLSFNGHWMYQPSVILPSSLTNYQYYLLFNSNLNANSNSDEAIFLSTSNSPTSGFSQPTVIL